MLTGTDIRLSTPTGWKLKREPDQPKRTTVKSPAEREQDSRGKGRAIVCAQCEQLITRSSARISVSGKHEHTCLNPHGIVYHIGCFETASGCLAQGAPSSHWSWFAGHTWQIVLCSGCYYHLGWLFRGPEGTFFGLILRRLEEKEEEGTD